MSETTDPGIDSSTGPAINTEELGPTAEELTAKQRNLDDVYERETESSEDEDRECKRRKTVDANTLAIMDYSTNRFEEAEKLRDIQRAEKTAASEQRLKLL
ncbi:hypothetical protein SARC_05470 [Sphaeroforma arctica JP610]|uniref:Uncharacterized protein n=1 Tax=Sphaeroforma arctica JP610 TaxID=667725 RepID=A0A0L0G223_9EUKA|nr:hypothetical protein SARC_05470 [Sphaeroforma arctica JP610]KNC82243.1 hypothetical protein SARC_05470 [Sphaeroforma arctica JP610]|eukprot:XP_014156145.1 hypothetical protein SARC_05470 [Sphaeroforma arctica JP610]